MVVGRQAVIESRYSTVICAPIYSAYHGLDTQVAVGVEEGLKHESSIHCDELVSLAKTMLTDYVGSLKTSKLEDLSRALALAVGIPNFGSSVRRAFDERP